MNLAKILVTIATIAPVIFVENHLQAQITIDASLTQSMFAPGSSSSVVFADTWTLDSFNSQTGNNQNWDFSNVTWPDTVAYTQIAQNYPSGTLLEDESHFQSSTHTYHAAIEFLGTTLITDQYFLVSDGAVELLGIAQNADFDGDGDFENGAFFYAPGEKILSFPIEMGSTWQTESATSIFANDMEVADLDERTTHNITGWGQANAMGITADCLRDDFKTELACASGAGYCGETNQVTLYCVPQTDGPLYFYMLFADLNSDGSVSDLTMWTFDTSLVLSSFDDLPRSVSNIVTYPNPFQNTVRIQFDVEKYGHLEIEVFDLLGQRLELLSNQEMAPGENGVSWIPDPSIPNGTYIIELRHEGISSHQKVALLR